MLVIVGTVNISLEMKETMDKEPAQLDDMLVIGLSGCVCCHGNKVSTNNGVIFSSLSLSLRRVTFLPEGVIVGFQNFACGFNSQKNKTDMINNYLF